MTEPARQVSRPRRSGGERLPAELAVLGTLLFHVVMLCAFRMAPPGQPAPVRPRGPECILVSPLAESTAWEREIHAWCFFADPALLSLPNDEHGFGLVRREERIIPVSDIPTYQCKVELRQNSVFPNLPLGGPAPSMDRQIVESWSLPPPTLPAVAPPATLPRSVMWYATPEGEVLNAPPAIPPDELQKALAENPTLVAPTQIEIDRTHSPTRLRLVQRSGSDTLDRLVLRVLGQSLLKTELAVGPARNPATAAGLPEKGQALTLAVEWRLAPPPPPAETAKPVPAATPAAPQQPAAGAAAPQATPPAQPPAAAK